MASHLEEPMMWNPPMALTPAEQLIAARTREARKFFVFLREHRHELLDADLQHLLASQLRTGAGRPRARGGGAVGPCNPVVSL